MAEQPNIHMLMPRVMASIGAVGKSLKNEKAGYSARSIDDVMNSAQSALIEHGVHFSPNVERVEYDVVEVGKNRTPMRQVTATIRYTFYGPAGDSFDASVIAEALDSGDKSSSKAMSMALKYALLQVLCVPTRDMKDADAETHERTPARVASEAPRNGGEAPKPETPTVVSPENAQALRDKCESLGVDVNEAVKLGTSGRTDKPEEVFTSEVRSVKIAVDELTPAPVQPTLEPTP